MAKELTIVAISEEHSSAICAEIGERLRFALRELPPASPALEKLMERLGELDEHASPSIVPSIDACAVPVANYDKV